MSHGLVHGHGVVARDTREPKAIDGRVHQHGGQLALPESGVVSVRRVALGIQSAGEHDARHLVLQQQLDVVGFGHAAGRLGAQQRRVALLRQGAPDHLGERREDGVLQLRQDQADESRSLATQLGRSLVAEDIESGQDRLARRLRDPGLVVEHPADGRLTHADLASHLCESSGHGCNLTQIYASVCGLSSSRGLAAARDVTDPVLPEGQRVPTMTEPVEVGVKPDRAVDAP